MERKEVKIRNWAYSLQVKTINKINGFCKTETKEAKIVQIWSDFHKWQINVLSFFVLSMEISFPKFYDPGNKILDCQIGVGRIHGLMKVIKVQSINRNI